VTNDPLLRFLLRHCLAGVLAGWTMVALLLGLDVAGLGTLVLTSDGWLVPLVMLLVFFAITFGSVAMGTAVMSLGRADGPPRRPRPAASPSRPMPLVARVRARIRP